MQWQPDGLTIHTNKCFLGGGFLGAPPISLTGAGHEGHLPSAHLHALAAALHLARRPEALQRHGGIAPRRAVRKAAGLWALAAGDAQLDRLGRCYY